MNDLERILMSERLDKLRQGIVAGKTVKQAGREAGYAENTLQGKIYQIIQTPAFKAGLICPTEKRLDKLRQGIVAGKTVKQAGREAGYAESTLQGKIYQIIQTPAFKAGLICPIEKRLDKLQSVIPALYKVRILVGSEESMPTRTRSKRNKSRSTSEPRLRKKPRRRTPASHLLIIQCEPDKLAQQGLDFGSKVSAFCSLPFHKKRIVTAKAYSKDELCRTLGETLQLHESLQNRSYCRPQQRVWFTTRARARSILRLESGR
jgi:hypothetical protein